MHIEVFVAQDDKRCQAVRRFLDGFDLEYAELDVGNKEVWNDLRKRLPGTSEVPQVFIDGDHIGGYGDLLKIAHEIAVRESD